jgi:hypothetical protein
MEKRLAAFLAVTIIRMACVPVLSAIALYKWDGRLQKETDWIDNTQLVSWLEFQRKKGSMIQIPWPDKGDPYFPAICVKCNSAVANSFGFLWPNNEKESLCKKCHQEKYGC